MNENLKRRLPIVGVIFVTVILAGIAVYTATRIWNSRNENISPASPEKEPLAQASSPTPTLTPTSTPTPTGLSGSPTPSLSVSPTASVSATLSPTKKLTPTPSVAETLPDAGSPFITVFGVSLGLVLLVTSLLLTF